MNVKELITLLSKLPDDMEVILQKDPEGNGYSPLDGVDPDCIYNDGECYSGDWSAGDALKDQDEWDEILELNRSVVLHPTY